MRIRNPLSGPPPWNRSWKSYRAVVKLWNRYGPAVPDPDGANRNAELASYLSDGTLVAEAKFGDLSMLSIYAKFPFRPSSRRPPDSRRLSQRSSRSSLEKLRLSHIQLR